VVSARHFDCCGKLEKIFLGILKDFQAADWNFNAKVA